MTRSTLAFLLVSLTAVIASPVAAQQPQPQPQSPGLQSGGLAPPPPMATTEQPPPQNPTWNRSETEERLDASERDDAGRGLSWVYLNAEGGFTYVGLEALKSDRLAPSDIGLSAPGGLVGVGAGIRLLTFTLGARGRLGLFKDWNLWTIGGEAGMHFPLGALEPHVRIGGGYAFLGSLDQATWGKDASVRGFTVNVGTGLDYYVVPSFSVGGQLTGDFLFLSRKEVVINAVPGSDPGAMKTRVPSGKGIGSGFAATVVLGLHF